MTYERFKDLAELITKLISILAAICGAAIWLATYVDAQRNIISGRQQASLQFVREYNNPEVLKLRESFFQIKLATHEEVDSKISALRGSTSAVMDQADKMIHDAALRQTLLENRGLAMRRLIETFDQIETCVRINICDKKIIYSFFKDDAYEINYLLEDFISKVEVTRLNFGKGLRILAYEPK